MNSNTRPFLFFFFVFTAIIAVGVTSAFSANVTLTWDANDPTPEGYRVFVRENGQPYDYENPIREDSITTCNLIGLIEGTTYHFVVRAFDGDLESADSDEVSYSPSIIVPNQVPDADAGHNQTVYEGALVSLDGSDSSDPDGAIQTYEWLQSGGTSVSIDGHTGAQASFTAPVVGLNGDTLTFSLTVIDNDGSLSISSTTISVLKSSGTDVDGDNVPDILDRFPNDPYEWVDNDRDGIGDNQDPDDDNDGMADVWEITHGLDPFEDDSTLDADGDGWDNLSEFQAVTDPTTAPGNVAPEAPTINTLVQTERVELTPVLISGTYFDADTDDHYKSHWQISTDSDFSTLILDEISQNRLTAYTVGEMILDIDTVYYWRVKFIDSRNGSSDWSQPSTFTTITADCSDDADINGIPDNQEVDETVDVNDNGISDCHEGNIMSVNTVEGHAFVSVETVSDNATLVSIKSLPTDAIPDKSVKMGFGLIGFKLYLQNGVKTATVKIHFSRPVSKDAQLYKYLTDTGWEAYENAVFAPNGKCVTLMLEDGGVGDEDGVENGVIVDPSGISDTDSAISDVASVYTVDGSSGSVSSNNCFISTGIHELNGLGVIGSNAAILMTMMLLAAGIIFAAAFQVNKNE